MMIGKTTATIRTTIKTIETMTKMTMMMQEGMTETTVRTMTTELKGPKAAWLLHLK